MKAYDLFIDNGLDKRWPKGIDKIVARSNFVAELAKFKPATEYLLEFLIEKKNDKKFNVKLQHFIIRELIKNKPELALYVINRLSEKPGLYLSFLYHMHGEDLKPYSDGIRKYLADLPVNTLDLLQKANSISDKEIQHAANSITSEYFTSYKINAKETDTLQMVNARGLILPFKMFGGKRNKNIVFAEILAANFEESEIAKQAIFEIIDGGAFLVARNAFVKYPIQSDLSKKELVDVLINTLKTNNSLRNFVSSDICLYLRDFDNLTTEYKKVIMSKAIFDRSEIVRMSCSLVFDKNNIISENLYRVITGAPFGNVTAEIEKIKTSANIDQIKGDDNIRRRGINYQVNIFNPEQVPNLSILYKAGLMLSYNYKDELGLVTVKEFFDSSVGFIRAQRPENDQKFEYKSSDALVSFIKFDDRIHYVLDWTPMDILAAVKIKHSRDEWESFIFDNLNSELDYKVLNSALLVNQYKIILSAKFADLIIHRIRNTSLAKVALIYSLQYVPRNQEIDSLLLEQLKSTDEEVKNSALKVLNGFKGSDI